MLETKNLAQVVGYAGYAISYKRYDRYWTLYNGHYGKNGLLAATVGKESVDTGKFIPGIYRVNPYKVAGGSVTVVPKERGIAISDGPVLQPEYMWGPDIRASFMDLDCGGDDECLYITGTEEATAWNGQSYVWLVGDWWRIATLQWANDDISIREAADYVQLPLQRTYGKLQSADIDFGEVLGEYRETIRMLRSPLSQMKKFLWDDKRRNYRLLIALAKGDRRGVNRLLGRTGKASVEAMTSTWLELRYGLRPLVFLVQDVIERVRERVYEFDPTVIRSARSRMKYGPYQTESSGVMDIGPYGGFFSYAVLVEDTYFANATVQYRQAEKQPVLDSLGLTPRYLPEIAWELTRASFVVDWIFSIGPWLATLRWNPLIEVLGNTTGFKHQRKMRLINAAIGCDHPYFGFAPKTFVSDNTSDHNEWQYEYSRFDRTVDTDLSYLPHFTWGRTLDLFKAIDSISLIWQSMPKRWR